MKVVDPLVKMIGSVYQVHDRANGKASLVDDEERFKAKTRQLVEQVEYIVESRGYKNPGLITFEKIKSLFDVKKHGHFYGERGTNEFVDCDAIVVLGAPLPPRGDIQAMAKMIFEERNEPFDMTWSTKEVPYTGQPWGYDVGGFWNDEDLQAVVHQLREAEIEQAAHRGRPIIRNCDIWLLTNIPIAGLPPTELLSEHEAQGTPTGLTPSTWHKVLILADDRYEKGQYILSTDLEEACQIKSPTTAGKYLRELAKAQPGRWIFKRIHQAQRGQPLNGVAPIIDN